MANKRIINVKRTYERLLLELKKAYFITEHQEPFPPSDSDAFASLVIWLDGAKYEIWITQYLAGVEELLEKRTVFFINLYEGTKASYIAKTRTEKKLVELVAKSIVFEDGESPTSRETLGETLITFKLK